MTHKIIQIENYLLVVSGEEIKVGDWLFANQGVCKIVEIKEGNYPYGSINNRGDKVFNSKHWKTKVIAHKPLNGAPYLDGVDVLPEIEDETQELSKHLECLPFERDAFKAGYNKAKETYKYTEADLRRAINLAYVSGGGGDTYQDCEAFVVEQLEKELPIAFECEMECCGNYSPPCNINCEYGGKPKTITNLQGRTEWVGEYEF